MLESNWSATLATLRPSFSVTFSHLIDKVVGCGINLDTVNKENNGKILTLINKDTKCTFVSAKRNKFNLQHGDYQKKKN